MQGLPPLPPGSTLGIALDQGDYPVQVYFYLDDKVRTVCVCVRVCVRVCACLRVGRARV